ncbi:hypothetical protein PDIDSM_2453 [Penicillium digitatum]|nr:hypothetical protein PDIDSM_2453 [Penicillium digitatum]
MSLRNLAIFSVLGLVSALDKIGFGPHFSLGPTSSWIHGPSCSVARYGTSGGDLIQALAVSFSDPAANCGATAGQWCTWASTLQGTQLGGKQVPANAGDEITMHYKYNDETGNFDQTVYINGEVVSTLSTNSGQAQGWGTAVECQDDACDSTTAAHEYLDTTIILDAADPSFGDTLAIEEVISSGLKTADEGKTWTVSSIEVQAHTYNL